MEAYFAAEYELDFENVTNQQEWVFVFNENLSKRKPPTLGKAALKNCIHGEFNKKIPILGREYLRFRHPSICYCSQTIQEKQ